MKLPSMPNQDKRRRRQEIAFGGVNYSENFKEGEWEETKNISCALFPSVIPRAGRNVVSHEDGASAIYVFDKLAKVVGTEFYWDGEPVGNVLPGKKQFAKVGNILCIFPDGAFFNVETGSFETTENTAFIPDRANMTVGENTLTYNYTGGVDYHFARNGETITGRGQISDLSTLNRGVWMKTGLRNSGSGVPSLRVIGGSEYRDIRDRRVYITDDGVSLPMYIYTVFPFYDSDSAAKYNAYDVLEATCEEKYFWPGIKRNFWTLVYGERAEGNPYQGHATRRGTISGWEPMTQAEHDTYSLDINRVNVVGRGLLYLNQLTPGQLLEDSNDGTVYTRRRIEDITRVQYVDFSIVHNGIGDGIGSYSDNIVHYYYGDPNDITKGIRTGIYEGVNNGVQLNIPGALTAAQISQGTEVSLTRGSVTVNAVFDSIARSGSDETITVTGDISALAEEIGGITIRRLSNAYGFDFITAAGNRLWAVKGDTIYASKWGDPDDFDSVTGTSVDPWNAKVGSDGEWTGIIEYSGNILCFKEDMLHMVMGTLPDNYQVYDYNVAGIKKGCADSAVIINEVLYYYGIEGVYRYSGNTPSLITPNFGLRVYENAAAGTDGVRYYISAQGGSRDMHVYDTSKGIWMREDELEVVQFARYEGKLYALASDGRLIMLGDGDSRGVDTDIEGNQTAFDWSMKSVPFYEDSFNRKYHVKLMLRIELFPMSSFTVSVSYDGGADTQIFRSQVSTGHRVIIVPVLPRRCDAFRLKIEGRGNFILRGIAREYTEGREY